MKQVGERGVRDAEAVHQPVEHAGLVEPERFAQGCGEAAEGIEAGAENGGAEVGGAAVDPAFVEYSGQDACAREGGFARTARALDLDPATVDGALAGEEGDGGGDLGGAAEEVAGVPGVEDLQARVGTADRGRAQWTRRRVLGGRCQAAEDLLLLARITRHHLDSRAPEPRLVRGGDRTPRQEREVPGSLVGPDGGQAVEERGEGRLGEVAAHEEEAPGAEEGGEGVLVAPVDDHGADVLLSREDPARLLLDGAAQLEDEATAPCEVRRGLDDRLPEAGECALDQAIEVDGEDRRQARGQGREGPPERRDRATTVAERALDDVTVCMPKEALCGRESLGLTAIGDEPSQIGKGVLVPGAVPTRTFEEGVEDLGSAGEAGGAREGGTDDDHQLPVGIGISYLGERRVIAFCHGTIHPGPGAGVKDDLCCPDVRPLHRGHARRPRSMAGCVRSPRFGDTGRGRASKYTTRSAPTFNGHYSGAEHPSTGPSSPWLGAPCAGPWLPDPSAPRTHAEGSP